VWNRNNTEAHLGGFPNTLADDLTFDNALSTGIHARDLTVRRGTEILFKALNFELQGGQLVWLRGSNGSGKTSLLRVIAGLSRPDGGQLTWNGEALKQSQEYRERLVYMGHANALKDDLTAMEALRFLTTVHGRPCPQDRMEAALRRMGVFHRRKLPVRMLSQGNAGAWRWLVWCWRTARVFGCWMSPLMHSTTLAWAWFRSFFAKTCNVAERCCLPATSRCGPRACRC